MKLNLLVLALMAAALTTPAITQASVPVDGATRVCRVKVGSGCPDSYYDPEGTYYENYYVPNTTYQSVQWIGTGRVCTSASDANGDNVCTTTFSRVSTGSVSWKFGGKVAFTPQIKDVASLTLEANVEFNRITTDTDSITETRNIPVGYSERPYTYVLRQKVIRNYFGLWRKGSGYGCGLFKAYTCYTYTWQPHANVLDIVYYPVSGEGQLFDFKQYANGTSSGLVLENDDN